MTFLVGNGLLWFYDKAAATQMKSYTKKAKLEVNPYLKENY